MTTIVIEIDSDVEFDEALDEAVKRIKDGNLSGSDIGFNFEVDYK